MWIPCFLMIVTPVPHCWDQRILMQTKTLALSYVRSGRGKERSGGPAIKQIAAVAWAVCNELLPAGTALLSDGGLNLTQS
jgi:hypothetical protein